MRRDLFETRFLLITSSQDRSPCLVSLLAVRVREENTEDVEYFNLIRNVFTIDRFQYLRQILLHPIRIRKSNFFIYDSN